MGLVVATGNVGTHLEQEPDEAEMFVSRDAGRSWSRVMEGSAAYDIGTICVYIYIYMRIYSQYICIYIQRCIYICVCHGMRIGRASESWKGLLRMI